jgi:hypothetical protein
MFELTRKPNQNLLFTLTNEGREELLDLIESGQLGDDDILFTLLEQFFCNGFTNLTGSDVGLTESVLIGENIIIGDTGMDYEYNEDSKVWWYPDYMLHLYKDILLRDNAIEFTFAGNG